MPRYFFDIDNGSSFIDAVGQDLQNDQTAWREALRLSRDLEDTLAPGGAWRLTVRRDEGSIFRIEARSEWLSLRSDTPRS